MFKKEFWKYFINVYKESKYLIIGYLLAAIYLTITSVIANKMNLINLTYFNSVIGLVFFGEIISFGLGQGIGLFVNQNIKDEEKVSNYVKIGMYINFILSFLFVILLAIFYKFVLHSVFELQPGIDYRFYFMMLGYIFIDCLLVYLIYMLKKFKLFFSELMISLVKGVLLVVGFLFIYFQLDLDLVIIPVVYIISTLVALVIIVMYFYKSSVININLFKFVRLSLNRKEVSITFNMIISQLIWQVGYTALSYALLKVSNIYFNQYSYYENVLDIFNGLFFVFVSVTSVDICRELGEGNFDDAYKKGKYSIMSTVVIWCVYLMLSFTLSSFIIEGMSVDIRSGAFIVMFLYVVMYLFRFLSWNLMSYILCWGGEMKVIIYQEFICSVYYVILLLFGGFIPLNIYLVYGLITLPVIFQTILGLFIFKRKKWMKQLSSR